MIKATPQIADTKGYVKFRDTYQSISRDEVYAVGIPKTGFLAERMAHVAARNIAAQIRGGAPVSRKAFVNIPAVCVMDAGNNGVIILADKMLPPRKHGVLIPGPQAHAMKLGFEKYFLWKPGTGTSASPDAALCGTALYLKDASHHLVMTLLHPGAGSGPAGHHGDAALSPAASLVPSKALATRVRNVLMVAVATLCKRRRSNPAPAAPSGGRYEAVSTTWLFWPPALLSLMFASSTGNNPPVTPTASQRTPKVMAPSRYTGSTNWTRTGRDVPGKSPNGPTCTR